LKSKICFVLLICILLFADLKTALATHETDHRFTVFGVVKNSSGVPQSNFKVMVTDTLTGEGNTVFTNERGYYEVLLHMHNNNLGDEVRITAGSVVKSIKADFNPEDKHTERKSEVNLEFAPTASESPTKGWTVAAGILLFCGILFLLKRLYQQRRNAKL
jgi:hypothetical protein